MLDRTSSSSNELLQSMIHKWTTFKHWNSKHFLPTTSLLRKDFIFERRRQVTLPPKFPISCTNSFVRRLGFQDSRSLGKYDGTTNGNGLDSDFLPRFGWWRIEIGSIGNGLGVLASNWVMTGFLDAFGHSEGFGEELHLVFPRVSTQSIT